MPLSEYKFYISSPSQKTFASAAVRLSKPLILAEHVEKLCAFFPRDYLNLTNLNGAADYISQTWKNFGLKVQEQVYESSFRNLFLEFAGKQSAAPALVIGAHYDAVPTTPGADDNASGVAGILELGRLFSNSPPPIPLILVAWTNEEQPFFSMGLRGSDFHARLLAAEKREVQGAISLEMIGRYYDDPKTQVYPNAFLQWLRRRYDRGNFIAFVSTSPSCSFVKRATQNFRRVSGFPVHAAVIPERLGGPRILGSDHHSFMLKGFQAMMITDTAENRRHPTLGTTYHTPQDTPDTLDYERMAQLVEGLYEMVQAWT